MYCIILVFNEILLLNFSLDFSIIVFLLLGYEPTKEELQNMINGVDKGQSGKLSFENFETAIMRKIMALDSDGDIMKSFRLFDVDDTGVVDETILIIANFV